MVCLTFLIGYLLHFGTCRDDGKMTAIEKVSSISFQWKYQKNKLVHSLFMNYGVSDIFKKALTFDLQAVHNTLATALTWN